MTPEKAQLLDWDRTHYWHAFTQMAEYEPFVIERGQGCRLIDIDGQEYLDGVSSLWCNVHGHRHPSLDAALVEQSKKIAHCTSLGASNPTTIELARRLAEISPAGLEHVFFSSDGSCAVEVALKMAFQYWQQRDDPRPNKTRYVALGNAYHGDTLGSVSVGGVERFHEMFRPLLFDVIRLPEPNRHRLPSGVTEAESLEHYLAEAEQLLNEHHDQIAAIVMEPLVMGAAGMVMHPSGYLAGMRKLTQQYDILLIADEVAIGMGRTGRMFASEHESVAPDLLCMGKGLTGGYLPMAATLATDEIWNAFLGTQAEGKTFFHGHTFGGNPLSAAVALANLEVFEQEQTLEAMQPKVERLAEHLARLVQHPHVGNVRQCGLLAGVELMRDPATREAYDWAEQRGKRVCDHALTEGVWLRPLGDTVVIMPPLVITLEELDQILAAVEHGIEAATNQQKSDSYEY